MELREYLSIRRSYNLVRKQMETEQRLTFVEFAILCRLTVLGTPLKTSQIAEYQGSLRPTMTHRTKHLSEMDLMKRTKGGEDRRNVVCEVTDEGRAFVQDVCAQVCDKLKGGDVLSRTTPVRVCYYIDAMGSLSCMSGDLVLLSVYGSEGGAKTVSDLVDSLGLLQPTVSMSVAALEREGFVVRIKQEGDVRPSHIVLSDKGQERAQHIVEGIESLVVRRRR